MTGDGGIGAGGGGKCLSVSAAECTYRPAACLTHMVQSLVDDLPLTMFLK